MMIERTIEPYYGSIRIVWTDKENGIRLAVSVKPDKWKGGLYSIVVSDGIACSLLYEGNNEKMIERSIETFLKVNPF